MWAGSTTLDESLLSACKARLPRAKTPPTCPADEQATSLESGADVGMRSSTAPQGRAEQTRSLGCCSTRSIRSPLWVRALKGRSKSCDVSRHRAASEWEARHFSDAADGVWRTT